MKRSLTMIQNNEWKVVCEKKKMKKKIECFRCAGLRALCLILRYFDWRFGLVGIAWPLNMGKKPPTNRWCDEPMDCIDVIDINS